MLVTKQPSEIAAVIYDFTDQLAGQAITAIQSVTSAPAGLTASAQAFAGAISTVTWSGGASDTIYVTTVCVTTAAGQVYELDKEIHVVEVGPVVPAGVGSAYLTAEQYVERFGYTETIRITDEAKSGTIDPAKISAAINDATNVAEAYLGRYTLPLPFIPPVLQGIVAALARELLHKSRVTEAVTKSADLARDQLKLISKGTMTLNVPVGETAPVVNAGSMPMTSGDAREQVFTPANLDGFANFGGSASQW